MTREQWIEKARREGFENDPGFDPDMFAAWDSFDAEIDRARALEDEERGGKPPAYDPEDGESAPPTDWWNPVSSDGKPKQTYWDDSYKAIRDRMKDDPEAFDI